MTFSISKMLKDGFGAFFNNLCFLLIVTAITTVAGLSLKFLFYSCGYDILGDGSIRDILSRQLLSYCMPTEFYVSPHFAMRLLFVLLGGLIASFQVAVVCQVALCIFEKDFSYLKIVKRSLSSPLLLLRLLIWTYFLALFIFVISFPFVVLLSMSLVALAAIIPTLESVLLEEVLRILGIISYQWAFFRFSFAIPHIFEGNSVFASIKKSWQETKQLPNSVFLVIFCIVMLTNLPLFLAWSVVDWQLNAFTLALLIFYSTCIEVLHFFLVLAPWYQLGSSK